jgi:hypothetical protein
MLFTPQTNRWFSRFDRAILVSTFDALFDAPDSARFERTRHGSGHSRYRTPPALPARASTALRLPGGSR